MSCSECGWLLETLKVPPGECLLQGDAGSTLPYQLITMAKERGKDHQRGFECLLWALNDIPVYTQ